uniref:Exosome complex component 10 homolog n=1 Tax=Schistocephalus solidus TaxID=70667 RepID=A0A0X3NKK8_SCHSO
MTDMEGAQSLEKSEASLATDRLVSTLVPSVAKVVKLSHEFPSSSTPAFTYYNDFPQYKAVMNGNANKILSLIQNIMDEVHGEGNILDTPQVKSFEEKFATILDINDRILDHVTLEMDHIEFPERVSNNAQELVVATQKKFSASQPVVFEVQKSSERNSNVQNAGGTSSSVKLLAAKNVSRPQVLFSRQPDNTANPFRPFLKKKPNAIVPLENSMNTDNPESEDYPHPYFQELEAFADEIAKMTYTPASNPVPKSLVDTDFEFVDSQESLDRIMSELKTENEIAVDLEHHGYRTFLGITCLLQLSTRSKDYVIDTLALRDHLNCLNEVFTDPAIVKVFHGSDLDLMWLQRDFSVYVVNLFDTGQASRLLMLPRFSLSYLLQNFANTVTNKMYQLADWRIRPLPQELIEYARSDTHYLLYIAEQLRGFLSDRGLLQSAMERSRELCLRIYQKPKFDPLGYLSLYKISSGNSLNKRQLYALKHLYALRDSIARREDESLQYVLPNHMMKTIAEELPRETTGIFACCSPIPPLVRKYVYDLHKIILDARNNKLGDLMVDELAGEIFDFSEQTDLRSALAASHKMVDSNLIAAPPHDFSRSRTRPTFSNFVRGPGIADSWCPPSQLGKAFEMKSAAVSGLCKSYADPSRSVLHKLLKWLQKVPVMSAAPEDSELIKKAAETSTRVDDPLVRPKSNNKEEDSRVMTAVEVIQVSELGDDYRPGSDSIQISSRPRFAANTKGGNKPRATGHQQWKTEKRTNKLPGGRPAKRFSGEKPEFSTPRRPTDGEPSNPVANATVSTSLSAVTTDDEEMGVVVIRDQKIQQAAQNSTKNKKRKRKSKFRGSDAGSMALSGTPSAEGGRAAHKQILRSPGSQKSAAHTVLLRNPGFRGRGHNKKRGTPGSSGTDAIRPLGGNFLKQKKFKNSNV